MKNQFIKTRKASSHRIDPLPKQFQFALDLTILTVAFVLAYLIRFDFSIPPDDIRHGLTQLPFVLLLQFVALILSGGYAFIWKYVGIAEIKAFVIAGICSVLPLLMLHLVLPDNFYEWRVPFSIILADTLLAFGGMLSSRVLWRAQVERLHRNYEAVNGSTNQRKRVLLVGAGRAGIMVSKEILRHGEIELEVKGFVDDDPKKKGLTVNGIKVLGSTRDLLKFVAELEIDHVVISIAQASRQDLRRIVELCERNSIKVRVIPALYEILQGNVRINRIRDVQIEDLLGREPVRLDEEGMKRLLAGKVVMVTGAGGSIGSELARQVARFEPSALLLVERAEFALFNIDRELRAAMPQVSLVPLAVDVGDEARMRAVISKYRPQVMLHAAAHKHVPLMELNPIEAVQNNVLNTLLLGELAGEFGTEVFVLISTDKAVRPSSVMGASKRMAELVIQHLDRRFNTRYVAVRFGNVIGSAGSVIPIFREQIYKGGPVTVTHPNMVRYFMTIPEAVQLVLQAGMMGEGEEIFILDMGAPVRILNLAKDIITLSGMKPYEDIDIVFTGIRPGEKLFEELETSGEEVSRTRHPKIFIGKITPYPDAQTRGALKRLAALVKEGDERKLRFFLNQLLPEANLMNRQNVTEQIEILEETPGFDIEPDDELPRLVSAAKV
ncbi:MAG: polysaccharide biosynthesis protein [Acidobacteria bacterium]|nr:polysaccharide biosynthesis protein [Acidobacteriota bacterium]